MLTVGVLVLMHDKQATMTDWQDALGDGVRLRFFHPVSHPLHSPQPQIKPLSVAAALACDAFVITGAPIDRLPFDQVHYYPEVSRLIRELTVASMPVLYSCWGALAALHTLYGVEKYQLPHKLFGAFPHRQLMPSPLLAGTVSHFIAPHARYTDMDPTALASVVTVNATTINGQPMLASSHDFRQVFLFAHLEYRRWGLWQEHQREPFGPMPQHDDPQAGWSWESTRQHFFRNWLTILTTQQRIAQ
ncbi:homoserine O-acetyltransferase/O-succinyltransferase family protein [Lacticaseibacillus sp. GG6-2]